MSRVKKQIYDEFNTDQLEDCATQKDSGASSEEMDEDNSAYVSAMLEKIVEVQIQTSKELRLLRLEVSRLFNILHLESGNHEGIMTPS